MTMLIEYLGSIPAGAVLGWIVAIILALVCIYTWAERYRKARNSYDDTKRQTQQNTEAIKGVTQQLHDVQQELSEKFVALDHHDVQIDTKLDGIQKSVDELHKYQKRKDVNDLKDRIEKSYRYYLQRAHNTNSDQVFITETEKETFDGLLESYEAAGGNSFIHQKVKPDFLTWKVIDDDELPIRITENMAGAGQRTQKN